jgi:hypothetical protein
MYACGNSTLCEQRPELDRHDGTELEGDFEGDDAGRVRRKGDEVSATLAVCGRYTIA